MRSTAALLALLTVTGLAAPAPKQEPEAVARGSRFVARFVDEFARVTCTEQVLQAKMRKSGKVEYKEDSTFETLVSLRSGRTGLSIDESRQLRRKPRRHKDVPLLLTKGFSTLLLVFHPAYRNSFEYTVIEDELVDGRRTARVHYKHKRGTPSPMALVLSGREYPLDLSGVAWIDPASGVISKMTAGLPEGMADIGVEAFRSEVQYAPVTLAGRTYWLPATASIDLESPEQRWRNTHQFNEYRRFNVNTRITMPDS